jgi:V8-like Glu-specific endopeptidase
VLRTIKTTLVFALLLAAAPAAAQAGVSAKEIRAYWTPERMETAIPGDALLSDEMGIGPLDLGLGLGETMAGGGLEPRVENPRARPFRTHGKVFFTLGGINYVCSGTSIKSKTRSLVATAGHCTYSEMDGYASNFMFAPAYNEGNTPFGEWTAKRLRATEQWEAREDIRYDVGMATVSKRNGRRLAEVVGKRGITFNKSRDQNFDAFGYPAGDPYDGESMRHCKSPAEGTDNRQDNPEPIRIDCGMTGGSSGGGWVINGEDVNSVVSYGYECTIPLFPCENPEAGKLFGPYFGDEIKQLYRQEKR